MKHKRFSTLLVYTALMLTLVTTAFADVGPKPSVRVDFTGGPGKLCYATLLSKEESTGPAHVYGHGWDTKNMRQDGRDVEGDPGAEQIWNAFQNYEDSDGFYFLQEWWTCGEGKQLAWTYLPPDTFKLLLYYPETGEYRVSPVCERIVFHSLYTADLNGEGELKLVPQYPVGQELAALLVRMALTIALELLVAFLFFGYRELSQVKLLAVVNVITQLLLNVAITLIDQLSGAYAFLLGYFLLEVLVFAVEAFAYIRLMPKYSSAKAKRGHPVLYALCANLASFAFGLWLSSCFPGIF